MLHVMQGSGGLSVFLGDPGGVGRALECSGGPRFALESSECLWSALVGSVGLSLEVLRDSGRVLAGSGVFCSALEGLRALTGFGMVWFWRVLVGSGGPGQHSKSHSASSRGSEGLHVWFWDFLFVYSF